jgi:hypothetical protein
MDVPVLASTNMDIGIQSIAVVPPVRRDRAAWVQLNSEPTPRGSLDAIRSEKISPRAVPSAGLNARVTSDAAAAGTSSASSIFVIDW